MHRRLVRKELDGDRIDATLQHRSIRGQLLNGLAKASWCGGGVSRMMCLTSTCSTATPLSSTGVSEIFCTTSMPSDTCPNTVLAVERRLIDDDDEELCPAAVRSARDENCRNGSAGHLRGSRFSLDLVQSPGPVLVALYRS